VRRGQDGSNIRLERAVIEFVGPAVSRLTIRRRKWRVVAGDRGAEKVVFGPTRDQDSAWADYRSRSGDQR
jgi:hypothetical protein